MRKKIRRNTKNEVLDSQRKVHKRAMNILFSTYLNLKIADKWLKLRGK